MKTEPSSVQQIEDDLKEFHAFCKQSGLTDDEIRRICIPLHQQSTPKLLHIVAYVSLAVLAYYVLQTEMIAWHLSALGRILMIKLLPFYDWQVLKGERCLIPVASMDSNRRVDCYFCETIEAVSYSPNWTDAGYLKEQFLDLQLPVIINHPFQFNGSVNALLGDLQYSTTYPCKIASNLPITRRDSTGDILMKTRIYNKYFLQFQNCDFQGVKAFRRWFPRQDFHVAEVSPVQYSWVLISRSYQVDTFRQVALNERLTSVHQIEGSNILRLHPVRDCLQECRSLEIVLEAGEVVLFTAAWDLEYRPRGNGQNFAVILEAH